ncbi:MAG: RpiB/LacA/LacB family sugar-phosphate isomerase [Treponema sp.]|nr:RpiB/LacA/LacB family sugar-phosphate isomerase [Treponema sp.]
MKIGIIQASSQASKNELISSTVTKYAPKGSEVINFGCTLDEKYEYSYIDISVLIGMLLASGAVDFVVTGCSSGQGMMLACNSLPGVICGYAPTPKDAYLFAQINNGNAVSVPLGEDYAWAGKENFERTIEALFSEPFGQGYPKSEAERKLKDTEKLKEIRKIGQVQIEELLDMLDSSIIDVIMKKKDVIMYVQKHGKKDIAAIGQTRFRSAWTSASAQISNID